MAGEVIAVVREEVVGCPLKLLRDLFDDALDFVLGTEGEALQQLTTKGTPRWFRVRLCPVYP